MAKEKPYSRLTHRFVQSVATEGRYGDGRGGLGLSLLVKRTKNGRWSKTGRNASESRNKIAMIGLGSFPAVTLALARDKALAQRETESSRAKIFERRRRSRRRYRR